MHAYTRKIVHNLNLACVTFQLLIAIADSITMESIVTLQLGFHHQVVHENFYWQYIHFLP